MSTGDQVHSAHVEMSAEPVEITWVSLVASLLVIAIGCVLSFHLQLKLEFSLLLAACRSVLQLSLLGYILVPIFRINEIYVVLPYCTLMVIISALEAASRQSYFYKGMVFDISIAIITSASSVMGYALLVILKTDPIWDAHYVIPIFGMLLGNSLTAISVAVSTALEEFAERRDHIEFRLSRGADRWEAVRPIMQRAVKLGTTPLINQMSVAGLVSIPGMMTGQILGGASPLQAARYQIVVLFLIGGTATLSSYLVLVLIIRQLVDDQLCLRAERLTKKEKYAGCFPMLSIYVWSAVEHLKSVTMRQFTRTSTSAAYSSVDTMDEDMPQ